MRKVPLSSGNRAGWSCPGFLPLKPGGINKASYLNYFTLVLMKSHCTLASDSCVVRSQAPPSVTIASLSSTWSCISAVSDDWYYGRTVVSRCPLNAGPYRAQQTSIFSGTMVYRWYWQVWPQIRIMTLIVLVWQRAKNARGKSIKEFGSVLYSWYESAHAKTGERVADRVCPWWAVSGARIMQNCNKHTATCRTALNIIPNHCSVSVRHNT